MQTSAVSSTRVVATMIVALIVGLPLATWLDVDALTEANLRRQAADLNSVISGVRAYYATNVVARVLAAPGAATEVLPNYASAPGAIPLPATLSLELARVVGEQQRDVGYRFVSDYPFHGTGQIVVSYETYSAVRDLLSARPLAPNRMKGIGREITPYLVEGPLDPEAGAAEIFSAHWSGVDFFMDPSAVGAEAAPRVRELLRRALFALEAAPQGEQAPG